jgi:arylsulfatase A-like enzyme
MYEGGLRVPAIIARSGQLPECEIRTRGAHSADWLPTLRQTWEDQHLPI